jgi:hypothetical protein
MAARALASWHLRLKTLNNEEVNMNRKLQHLPWTSALKVTIGGFDKDDQLSCGYDRDGDLVYLTTPQTEPSPFGINIDNGILLDLAHSRRLIFVECLMQFSRWPEAVLAWPPKPDGFGALYFVAPCQIGTIFTEVEFVRIVADRAQSLGLIQFGSSEYTRTIKIGSECYAYLLESVLVGFIFRLAYPIPATS